MEKKYKVNFTCPECGGHVLGQDEAVGGNQTTRIDSFETFGEGKYVQMEGEVIEEDVGPVETIRWSCQSNPNDCYFEITEPYLYGPNNEYEGTQTPSEDYVFNWLKERGMIEEITDEG